MEHSRESDESRDGPPEHKTQFQDQLGQIELRANPSKATPDERGAEYAKEPTRCGDDPEQCAAAGSLCGFQDTQADTQLRARSEITRGRDRDGAKGMKQFVRGGDFPGASGALTQVRVEPGLVRGGESFDKRLIEKPLGTLVKGFAHAAPCGKADFSAASPR